MGGNLPDNINKKELFHSFMLSDTFDESLITKLILKTICVNLNGTE